MGKRYRKAEGEDFDLLVEVIRAHHRELETEKVRVTVVLIDPELDKDGRPKGPAITHGGDPAVARIKRGSAVDRLLGNHDARIEIDGFMWDTFSEERQRAVLDHELCHLVLECNAEGQVKHNDDGTARLGRRGHDWALKGFAEVAERHGADALEVGGLRMLHEHHEQLLFGFLRPPPPVGKVQPDDSGTVELSVPGKREKKRRKIG